MFVRLTVIVCATVTLRILSYLNLGLMDLELYNYVVSPEAPEML